MDNRNKTAIGANENQARSHKPETSGYEVDFFRFQVIQVKEMARFATKNGLHIPGQTSWALTEAEVIFSIVKKLDKLRQNGAKEDKADVERVKNFLISLNEVSDELSEIVYPATPETIMEMEKHPQGGTESVHKKLYNKLIYYGKVSLAGFILSSMLNALDWVGWFLNFEMTMAGFYVKGLFYNLTIVFAASLGASFFGLFTMHRYISTGSFNSRYYNKYISRYVLGIISGYVLAMIFSEYTEAKGMNDLKGLGVVSFAILGGYSADAVNKILTRLVDMMVALVEGGAEKKLDMQEQEFRMKLKMAKLKEKENGKSGGNENGEGDK